MDFEAMWRDIRPDIERSASGLAGNYDDTEDLVQDVAIGLWSKREQVKDASHYRRLAFVILGRRWIDMLRERSARSGHVSLSELDTNTIGCRDLEAIMVESGIDGLPEERYEAVLLHGMGFTYEEIGGIMDVPDSTVGRWVANTKKRLREM